MRTSNSALYRVGKRTALAILGLALVTSAGAPARADAPQPRADAPQPRADAAPDANAMEEARRHFQLGLSLLRDPEGERVEAAYMEFKAAFQLSKSPRVLGNIGYCAMKLERISESVEAYRQYLKSVSTIDPVERAQIDQDLVTMAQGSSTMTVRYTGTGAWTMVDERVPVRGAAITNVYGPTSAPLTLLVHPGHHVVRLRVDSEEQGVWELDSTSGASFTHDFAPKPAAPPVASAPPPQATPAVIAPPPVASAPRSKTAPWITVGVGGAMLAAGTVTGILALGRMNKLERDCPNNACADATYHADVTAGRTLGTATDVLLIGGGVVAAGGLVWLLASGGGGERPPSAVSVSGACAPGSCGFSAVGSF